MVTSINNIKYFIKMNNKTELITANKSMYKYQCFLFCCTMISLFFSFVTLATGRLVAGISCRKFWLGIWGGWNVDKNICQSTVVVSTSNTDLIYNLWFTIKIEVILITILTAGHRASCCFMRSTNLMASSDVSESVVMPKDRALSALPPSRHLCIDWKCL